VKDQGARGRRVAGFPADGGAPRALLPLPAWADDNAALAFQNGNRRGAVGPGLRRVALAIAAGLWALAEQRAARRLRRTLRHVGAKTKAALGEREALLSAGREALVVWGPRRLRPLLLWRRR